MGYQPGLDGLRALSVVLVILYHAGVTRHAESPAGVTHGWFVNGGFLGVEVFFVVSGFLITSLLLEERAKTGKVNLGQFWLRRFRRLLPALWVMVATTVLWATFWGKDFLPDLKHDTLFGLFYMANFQQLFGKVSYFGGFPHLLRHLWSLAVEEHFYLFFPPLFALVMRRRGTNPRRLLRVTMPLAAASAVLLIVLWSRPVQRLTDSGTQLDDVRQNWAYLSTFTRAAGILIGVSLAVVWSPWKRKPARYPTQRALDAAGLLAVGGIVLAALTLSSESAVLYRGGLTMVSLLSAIAIAAVVHPKARLMRTVFGNKAMAAIGQRSYGLYLWHWPIFVGPLAGKSIAARIVIGGLATVVLSEACYRFVETPIRKGAVGRWLRSLRAAYVRRERWAARALPAFACFVGIGLLAGALVARLAIPTADEANGVGTGAAGAVQDFDPSAALGGSTTAAGTGDTTVGGSGAVGDSTVPGGDSTVPGGDSTVPGGTVTVPTTERSARTPALAPPIPPTSATPELPRSLVIVGDSQADALAKNLPRGTKAVFTTVDGGLQGCGVYDEGTLLTDYPHYVTTFERCRGGQAKWAAKAANAEVALVVLGAWDVFDLKLTDRSLVFGTPEFDTYWLSSLQKGIDVLKAAGAQVALLEVECMRPQDVKGAGTPPLPERAADSRTGHVNELLAKAAAADPTHVFYVPGPRAWCEDDTIASDLTYRWDGVHLARPGAKLVLETITPDLLAIPVSGG